MSRLFRPADDSIGLLHDQLAHLAKIQIGMPAALGSPQVLTREQLAVLVETAFWASLRSNEGRTTRFRLTLTSAQNFRDAFAFATPVPYDESQIAKLAPAVPPMGCLIVSGSDEGFSIWGFGRTRPAAGLDAVTIEVSEPGTVRVGLGPLQPFAVLNGRSNPVVGGTGINLAHYLQRVLRKALPTDDILETQAVWRECLVLAALTRMIITDRHGGIILIGPNETGPWVESLNPFAYRFAAPDAAIRDGIRRELNNEQTHAQLLQRLWQTDVPDDLKHTVMSAFAPRPWYSEPDVRAVASLAGVDGAIVLTRDLRVLGFGAKLAGVAVAEQVCVISPGRGNQPEVWPVKDLGGTRHQSAAQFVAGSKDTVTVVISQDRHVSVMHWEESLDCVVVVRNVEWWV